MDLSMDLSIFPFIDVSIYLTTWYSFSIYLSIFRSIDLFIYLST